MRTKFGKVTLEGYGSILSKLEYNLDSPGLNIINAKNGAGKTTIFSGWSWVLYGITLKPKSSIEPWEDVKKVYGKFKGTRGITDFTKDGITYHVVRHVKYKGKTFGYKGNSELMLFQDGKKREDLREKKDVQAEIISLLGMSHDLFKNSVLFGQRMKRLIEEDGPSKKKIFEEAFEADYLKKAAKKAEDKRKDIILEIHKLEPRFESQKVKIKTLEERRESEKEQIRLFKEDKKEVSIRLKKEIKQLQNKISQEEEKLNNVSEEIYNHEDNLKKLTEEITALEIISDNYNKISDLNFKAELNLLQLEGKLKESEDLKKELAKQWGNIKTSCDKCGSKISKEKIRELKISLQLHINITSDVIKVRKNEVEKLKKEIFEYSNTLNHSPIIQEELKEKRYQKNNLEKNLNTLLVSNNNLLDEYNHQLKKHKKAYRINKHLKPRINIDYILDEIEITKKELIPIEIELAHFNKQLDLYNWVIKDPLSNSGIKAYIFNEMIKLINEALKRYAKFLGFDILLGIDMASSNKNFFIEISSKDFKRPYPDLSGGQKQLTDVSLAFAVHDVVSIDNGTNVLITDEAFEGLDADNIELVSELIAIKANNRSVHVITHLTDFSQTNAKVSYLKFRKGMTTLVA